MGRSEKAAEWSKKLVEFAQTQVGEKTPAPDP